MRLLVFRALILPLAIGLLLRFGLAQEAPQAPPEQDPPEKAVTIAPEHHPWGSFEPGAWKLVRVVTETLDEKGKVASTSTTETKTTLLKIEDDGVTLEVEVCVEVAGKRFAAEPLVVKQGFHGELISKQLKIKEAGKGEVTIEEQKIPCRILRLEKSGPTSKTVTSLYYSTMVAPYMLRRESVTTDLDGKMNLSETTVNVAALNAQHEGFDDIRLVRIDAVHKHPKGTVKTMALTSPDRPGGIIRHESEELDKSGRLIRRSTLEILEFGLEPERERTGIFGIFSRKRSGRFRKPPRRYVPW